MYEALVGSCRLPQALFRRQAMTHKWLWLYLGTERLVAADSRKVLAFTNGSGSGYNQFMIQLIIPQQGGDFAGFGWITS
jgi:hypothetical protein